MADSEIDFDGTSRRSTVFGKLQLIRFELGFEAHGDAVGIAAAVKGDEAGDIGRGVAHSGAGEIEIGDLEIHAHRRHGGISGIDGACLAVKLDRATARLPIYEPRTVRTRLGTKIVSPAGRHQFYTVRLKDGVAYPAFKGAGEITSLSQADGYIEIPPDQSTVDEGSEVVVTLF